ncbi:DNA/RNA non-specific endonuclease [Desemzia sp. C1]|uniref:DNA/RNA non-specific endonuclease n=1 Tax=Desemzia sp. C1 TaxID=2892016 RepID=UPI001E488C46|nr:DNA/RNA non-specific endonuclease [Desemzia sp. C1]MCI3027519.1 DNA/RNA non-specific endonuclease [Desemzia sp. C1]
MIKRAWLLLVVSSILLISACTPTGEATEEVIESESVEMIVETESKEEESSSPESEASEESESESAVSSESAASTESKPAEEDQSTISHDGYTLIEVDGGDLSGYRQANVVVDIGFGDREYWAYTNEYGQLVRVVANEIVVQDDSIEPVNSNGRYFSDEAKVPGTEDSNLDEGHIIADSLGGVANAYNITPQDSVLNRHGDQAYMERTIQQAGGATNFEAIITYPNTTTQIPSRYKYTYTVNGNQVGDEFDNINPDEYNEQQGLTGGSSESSSSTESSAPESAAPSTSAEGDVSTVDANGNGTVTIDEAKSAGYSMPITSDHWLYQYMRDNDNDGMVGE